MPVKLENWINKNADDKTWKKVMIKLMMVAGEMMLDVVKDS
jgi:hypothetical protein